ncbi:MAG: RloB domain-containing protein [Taibaiella sp.]|nr:RloB domain-containing protein [Taibaiella sp.]
MGHKKRGYKRDETLVRDYTLFAIACEGGKREPEYFRLFQSMSPKIKVDIIGSTVPDAEMKRKHETKSSPKWVLDRAIKYIETEGLSDEDQLWFVMDIDQWETAQLREIYDYCQDKPNWNLVLSNPCFEVWLYFHKKAAIVKSASITCNDFKNEISTFEKGGYRPHTFIKEIENANRHAKKADSDKNHFLPKYKETKVYQLGEALVSTIGKSAFDDFLANKLPALIRVRK